MADPLKLLAIFPHPDDETLGAGSTLARYAAEGVETCLVCATRGERGWSESNGPNPGLAGVGQIREGELRCAADLLGLKEVAFLDYIDGNVDRAEPQEVIARIADHIRRIQPQVLITFPPTILGPVIHSGLIEKIRASLLGSLFVFLGAVILSHRVIETIAKGITTLDPYSGFAAQLGAGICVPFFTFLGMPISTTYCIIGGISGVGMSKGLKTVKIELIKKIIANCFLAPSLAFLISFTIMRAIS